MTKKFLIGFLLSIALLVCSEYFLLDELYAARRASVVFFTSLGLVVSIVSFSLVYKNFRRTSAQPSAGRGK